MKHFLTWVTLLTFAVSWSVPSAYANPELDQITHGSASINVNGDVYNVNQASQQLIADFHSFNIAAHETTNVNQPGINAAALFHINDQNPSQILGALNANGNLFLENANGIIFGEDAQVNVGSLVASTLAINDQDFLNGNYQFTADPNGSGLVLNQGNITAREGGYVALLGSAVSNAGSVSAEGGSAVLAAGDEVTLSLDGDGLVSVAVSDPLDAEVFDFEGNKVNDQIHNAGTVTATGGRVILSASAAEEVFDNVINHEGLINATSVVERNGEIYLTGGDEGIVRISGDIDASGKGAGETGGTIHLLGDKVGLFGEASIDVSGDAGGGTILVGGDTKGANPDIQNATATYAGSNVTINADAINTGDGGKVVLWGNEVLKTDATITARGGQVSGDGGFVETSAAYFEVQGEVDVTSQNGDGGTWLLDPTDVDVTAATLNFDDDGGSPTRTFSAAAAGTPATLAVATLNTALAGGGGVTAIVIDTISGLAETGSITISSAIAKTAGGAVSLTFTATNGINLNNNITSTSGAMALIFNAGAGTTTLGAGVTLTSLGGAVTFNQDVSGAQTLTVNSGGGDVNFNGIGAGADPTALTVNAVAGAITFSTASVNVAGNIDLTGGNINTNTAVNTSGGGFFESTNSGVLAMQMASDFNLDGAFLQNGAGLNNLQNDITTTGDNISFATAVNMFDTSTLSTGAGAGNVTFSGNVNNTQTLNVTAGTGNVTFGAPVGDGVGAELAAITINSAANVEFDNTVEAGTLTQTTGSGTTNFDNTATITGAVNVSNDAITFTTAGNISAAGQAVTLNAETGAITGGTAGADVTSGSVNFDAVTGIGTGGNALAIVTPTVNIDNSGTGVVNVSQAATAVVTLNSLTNGTGTLTYAQTGVQTLNVTTATSTGAVTISNAGAADINIDNVTANSGNAVSITSGRHILETGADGAADVTGGTVTFVTGVAGDVGTGGNPLEVTSTVLNTAGVQGTANITAVAAAVVTGNFAAPVGQTSAASLTGQNISASGGNPISLTSTGGSVSVSNINATSNVAINAGSSINGTNNAAADITGVGEVLLEAGATIGSQEAPVSVQVTGSTIKLSAGTETNGLSVNVTGNVPWRNVDLLNLPPGLVLYNNMIIGGANFEYADADLSSNYGANEDVLDQMMGPDSLLFSQGFASDNLLTSVEPSIDDSAVV